MDTADLSSYLDTAARIDQLKDYPLDSREPTHVVYREKYAQNVAAYAPLALSTEHPDFAGHYMVYDRPYKQQEDVIEFDRHWSNIPARWSKPVTIGFDYPGYAGTLTAWGAEESTGVTAVANADGSVTVTKTAHGKVTGDLIRLWLTATTTGLSPRHFYLSRRIASHTTDTFTIAASFFGSWTLTDVTYISIDGWPTRGLRSETVTGLEVHEYALPGITTGVAEMDDFGPLPKQQFLSSLGVPVTELAYNTQPSNAQWIAAAEARERFVYSSVTDVYLGEILERVTIYVPFLL